MHGSLEQKTCAMPGSKHAPAEVRHVDGDVTPMHLKRWFFSRTVHTKGPLRVWGYAPDGRLWRSSSVTRVTRPRELVTRYGTRVMLVGPIDSKAARAAQVPDAICRLFADGLPLDWERVIKSIRPPNDYLARKQAQQIAETQLAMNAPASQQAILNDRDNMHNSTDNPKHSVTKKRKHHENSRDGSDQPAAAPAKRQAVSRRRQRRVAFAADLDHDDKTLKRDTSAGNTSVSSRCLSETSNLCEKAASTASKPATSSEEPSARRDSLSSQQQSPPPPLRAPEQLHSLRSRRRGVASRKETENFAHSIASVDLNDSDSEIPGTPLLPQWSREQLDAYDERRTAVAADSANYWELVADGVPGKCAADCLRLWNSTWTSPADTLKPTRPRKAQVASTPEVAGQILNATGAAAKRSAKYKTNVRKLAAAVNRDVDDDMLEPRFSSSPDENAPSNKQLAHPVALLPILQHDLRRGTPDTAAKMKRAAAEKAGASETPEILARGRSFGLAEADQYISVFHRRVGAATSNQNPRKQASNHEAPQRKAGSVQTSKLKSLGAVDASATPLLKLVDDINREEAAASVLADEDSSSDDYDLFF